LLQQIQSKHPDKIKGPFGIGSMFAFSVFDGDPDKTTKFVRKLFDEGLIVFTAGTNPMKIRMLLPVPALKDGDLEKAFAILEKVLCSS
jgi:4-aminobutyrate aminotransferase-like enzyme